MKSVNILKSRKGLFTKYCGGNVTNACIKRGLKSKDPVIRKRANFARNARSWKHKCGGIIRKIK